MIDQIMVGFYDRKTHSMIEVEPWTETIQDARIASAHMAVMYQTGRHRLPTEIWCVWNQKEFASIFFLDDKPSSDTAFMNSILALMV
jgi:hypothetical protein